jgi:hypothetical protein
MFYIPIPTEHIGTVGHPNHQRLDFSIQNTINPEMANPKTATPTPIPIIADFASFDL